MQNMPVTRRNVLRTATAAAVAAFARPARAAAPEPSPVTPALIDAARKEGKVVWYAAMDLPVSERVARGFEAKYPGIAVRIERTGSERQFQRLAQEYAANIFAVDVINASDASHFIAWKRNGWLAPYVPEDVARYFEPQHRDPDGCFATLRVYVVSLGYNTNLVKPEDAPKSFLDLLHPRWLNKIVKAHPAYSGTIMTSTFQVARELGWEYFEKLAKQKVLQVQSSVDPPNKLALGERQVMADGNDFNLIQFKEAGKPVEVVYPLEGSPLIVVPQRRPQGRAQSQRGAAVAELYLLARGPAAAVRLCRAAFRPSAGGGKSRARRPLAQIKVMRDDPAAVEAQAEEIKAHYAKNLRRVIAVRPMSPHPTASFPAIGIFP